jgi:hypothetical protein
MQWNKRAKWACALGAIALYFSVALGLKSSYVPPPTPPGEVIALARTFSKFGKFGFVSSMPQLSGFADTVALYRSPAIVYENDRPLGPAHSLHGQIAALGGGRFSHWEGVIAFSSSDNTNPNSNGRKYWVAVPK